ncbi:MAG: FG-GAP-like repeat-containing protein [Bryobacteraceae bacterium]|jgi:tetratricopeptide (TPR) repeat protein
MKRRDFLGVCAAPLFVSRGHAASPFPVTFRQEPAYAPVLAFAEPGFDEFPAERAAMELEMRLATALSAGDLPFAAGCTGASPAPSAYRKIAPDVAVAVFDGSGAPPAGWQRWRASLGAVRRAAFYSLPGGLVRYDIRGAKAGRLEHRVGIWKFAWNDGAVTHLEPLEEALTSGDRPWFRDVTGAAFAGVASFREQLAKGVPYWRARLDPATGVDIYGENGIAVGDVDNDGLDEIYVCQPGGLPNRLYRNDGNGRFRDVSHEFGLDILDNTTSALFADLRNSGHQDLVLVRPAEATLFLNDGKGKFTPVEGAFRFQTPPQGTFTSISAADYDRDGRLDLYLCTYIYFQSEAQYKYPVPYHDARNGPPNYLFRNCLDRDPPRFEDVTAATGMDHNNNRFSFAGAWCDYNASGWPSLYVANDFGRKNLYRNTNGHFSDVAEQAGVDDVGPGMSAAWLDYDGDGRPDLLVSNMWSATGQRITHDPAFGPAVQDPSLRAVYQRHVKGNSLFHNEGDGTFTYTGDSEAIEMGHWSWSCDGSDFDNDKTPEIYIACGMLSNNSRTDLMSYFYRQVVAKSPVTAARSAAYENGWNAINQLVRGDYSWAGPEPNVFYARRGRRFYDFSGISGIDLAEDSRAFALLDFDGDGCLDLAVKSRMGPQLRVFQNDCGSARQRVVFRLRGTKSNRDAVGARVDVDGQVKWVVAGSAYLSQHTKRLHFGLGDARRTEKVRIVWPSGLVQDLPPLDAGYVYEVTEGVAEFGSERLRPRIDIPAGPPIQADNRSRLFTTWLREPVPLPEKRPGPALVVLHAGERLPEFRVPTQALDLRSAPADLAAAYALFRRYLFDYRTDLATPFWMLIDAAGRVRRVYEDTPTASAAEADWRTVEAAIPDARALPFDGFFLGRPARDYFKIGGAMLMSGYPEQALPYLEEARLRSPNNARTQLAIGRIHLQANRLAPARQALEAAAKLDASQPEVWNDLGGVEAASGNPREALKLYQRALALDPNLPYVLVNAGAVEQELQNAAEAERFFRRALAADPRSGDAANKLGLLLAKAGRADEARALFEQAISVRRDDASAINNLAVLYINTGKPNDAIAAFQYGIEVAPDDETLYLNLGRLYVSLRQRDKARDVMQRLLVRRPGDPVATRALQELESR